MWNLGLRLAREASMWFIFSQFTARVVSFYAIISAQVFEGSWNKLRVALKVLKTKNGITPNPAVCIHSAITFT